MRWREGCGYAALGFLFVVVACLVFAALVWALVLTGEVPLYAPRLLSYEPWPGYSFQPSTPITLTFDQPMDPASVEAAFSLEPAVSGTFRWSVDRSQATFVSGGTGFEPGTTYQARLAAGAQAGTIPRKTAASKEWTFALPPLLQTQTPEPTVEGVGPWLELQATFNYLLDCTASVNAFAMSPDTAGLLDCEGYTLTFSPTLPFEPDAQYVAEVGRVYLSDGWARPGVRWEIQTAPPLTIVDATPVEGESLADLWTPIRVAFSRPVVAKSLPERFALASEDGPSLPGKIVWDGDGAGFVFQPQDALRPASRYRFTLAPGVRDELGFKLAEGLDRSFETDPMLAQILPQDGTRDVLLSEAIRISFTRAMDQASVEAGLAFTPTLRQSPGGPLDGEVTWEENTMVFRPQGGLAASTQYQVSLGAGIRDASGAPLAATRRWTFGTQPFLLGAEPASGAVLVELQTPIEYRFALPMDRASVQAALSISPATAGEMVWSDDSQTVAFQPDPAWLSGAEYEVILSGWARTADGYQTLGEDQALRFSTAQTQVRFGEGPNVQVMGGGGERAFQVVARGADVADFYLYPITPTQFLELYSSGFRGIGPQEPQIVATADLTPTVEWREVLTPLGDRNYGDWQPAEAHIPADVPSGIYILASPSSAGAAGEELGTDHLLVVLTRHVLVLKRALAGSGSRTQAQIVAWDTEIGDGAPVVSATLRLYDRDGVFLAEGVTDAEGLLALDVPGDPGPLLALSDKDGDVTVCGLSNEWSEGGWWWWWTAPASRPLHTIYSYTDRPIYRPGQTVYFKDFVRADDDVSYTLPSPDLPITVRLRDARDNVAASQVLTPTQFGTAYGEFQLADEPMLGTWNLETEVDGTAIRQPLKVEEYRKPEYEVTVATPLKTYVHGEAISVTVGAAYYFGQPVADADVILHAYPAYPDYYLDGEELQFGYPILSEEGRTDAEGRWVVVVPTDEVFSEGNRARLATLALEATVTDDSGQSVSSYQTIIVQRTSQGLVLVLEKHGYLPNEEIAVAAQVRGRDGEPVTGVELTAQVFGWDDREVTSVAASTDDRGEARFSLQLAEQGWYRLGVEGIDDGGREMLAVDYLWIYDPSGQAPWYQGRWIEEPALTVSADRPTYAVGEEAQILVYAPVSGQALLTLERGETRHAQPIDLVSGTNLITLPIRSDYAPNIYVAVSQFGPLGADWWYEQSRPEAQLHKASTQLLVPMTDRLLVVTLTADREAYAPGDEATFQLHVTDQEGQPVIAEVSLAVVDEAIYALAEDLSRDPFEVFYGSRSNLVRTFDSLNPIRWLFPEGPGLGGDGEEEGGAPRRDFPDTAHWVPAAITDENGEATITFELPDNLTEWRALARAVTTDTRVGQATTGIVVSKEIVVRPALPRFLIQGDAITLTAVIHNFTEQAVSATVQIDLNGMVLVGEPEGGEAGQQVVAIPARGSAAVGWPAVAQEPGDARIVVEATATHRGARLAGRDGVELTLPVHPLAVPEVANYTGELTPARPTATVTITLPSDAIQGLSRLEINLAPTVAPGLLDGLEYLIDYPFG